MKSNPNKPRMLRDETAGEYPTDKTDLTLNMLSSPLGSKPVLTGLNTSEIAGVLTDDPALRDELLASLEGRKKSR